MRLVRFGLFVVLLCLPLCAIAQNGGDTTYSRRNTFGGFFEYSNDSSHILLGTAENRKIGAIGFQYQRRLLHRPLLDLSYVAEVRPGMLESDPVQVQSQVYTSPIAMTYVGTPQAISRCQTSTGQNISVTTTGAPNPVTYTFHLLFSCSRRLAVEQGFSPGGVRVNLMPRRRLQPTVSALAGYIFSSQQVPTAGSAYFNFAFEVGAGLEWYQSHTRSVRLEYQLQHYGNNHNSQVDPGVDSGLFKLTYGFGR